MELVQASISCPLRHWRRTEDCADQALVGSVLRHTNYGHAQYLEKLDDNVYRLSDTMGDMMYTRRIRKFPVLSPNRLLGLPRGGRSYRTTPDGRETRGQTRGRSCCLQQQTKGDIQVNGARVHRGAWPPLEEAMLPVLTTPGALQLRRPELARDGDTRSVKESCIKLY
jgi:hypothetical protein